MSNPCQALLPKGQRRSAEIASINGRFASTIIGLNDFSLLTPANVGDTLSLVLRNASGLRSVSVTALASALTPISSTTVVTAPAGRHLSYLVLKDVISRATGPLAATFAQFRAAGVSDLALDLRYNGGRLVSVAGDVASLLGGAATAGSAFCQAALQRQARVEQQRGLRFRRQGCRAVLEPRLHAYGTSNLLGQRAGYQRPAWRGYRGGGHQRHHLRQGVGFLPLGHCGITLLHGQFRIGERTQLRPLLQRFGADLPFGR